MDVFQGGCGVKVMKAVRRHGVTELEREIK